MSILCCQKAFQIIQNLQHIFLTWVWSPPKPTPPPLLNNVQKNCESGGSGHPLLATYSLKWNQGCLLGAERIFEEQKVITWVTKCHSRMGSKILSLRWAGSSFNRQWKVGLFAPNSLFAGIRPSFCPLQPPFVFSGFQFLFRGVYMRPCFWSNFLNEAV